MAGIELRKVVKNFGKTQVIEGISQSVPDGTFLVIVGPSGCGKSTVLRLIAGLEEVTSGEIFIGERDVARLEPKDRDVAMVFQNYALYPHMSVRENICYGLKVRGLPKAEQERRLALAADMLGLSEYLDRSPRQLSGGQRQRVAMGRAIVREAAVFLFDEPLSNLDASLRNQMRVELRRLHERLGTTSIYVTHDQVEAMTLAQRIMVMNQGHVEQYGTPDELYLSPATVFTARFIGSPNMNMLRASLERGRLKLPGGTFLPPIPATDAAFTGRAGEILLGVRPEDLLPAGENAPETLRCRVELVEVLGADTLVHCALPNEAEGQEPIIARLEGSSRPGPGDVIHLGIRHGKAHLFDPVTKKRLAV
ncbi:MAG: sn-glycerol-3-phosphate ABC transporter ATP-binding protein UgpC [Candidatus Accumulibacter sp.]|jgi:sn-glycerol 3-phosphate transport system ATP-binding protein|nr:sn-glycerol-3-phosphate ABC transporter ATP-binding protein UgpC [Accumulibacter sp.]